MFERTCNDADLDVLLHGVESSAAFRKAASHVERCGKCQASLTESAANGDDWRDAHLYLAPRCGEDVSSLSSATFGDTHRGAPFERGEEDTAFDFLAPPRHPEMLGRLGRYEIERHIGSGGMGVVFKAHDTELNRPVAIKVLAPHLGSNHAARRRFAREAKAAAAVVHENVVAIHNVSSLGKLPYFVMQYVAGRSLQARVDEDGPLEVKEILRIGIQVCAGLAAAHEQGLVHRDVKPSNILLENGVERVLLTDFGLARAVDDATVTRSGVVTGTPDYMSPEQANAEPVDQRSDLFSLGSVLYFISAGHPPFRADRAMAVLKRICHSHHRPITAVNPDIPSDLAKIIERLLAKKPHERYADAGKIKEALTKVLCRIQQGRILAPNKRRVPLSRRALRLVIGTLVVVSVVSVLLPQALQFNRPSSSLDTTSDFARDTWPDLDHVPLVGNDSDAATLQDVTESLNRYGLLCLQSGHLEQARESFEKALKVGKQFAMNAPNSIEAERSVAQSLHCLATCDRLSGDLRPSWEQHQQVLRIRERLAKDNPNNRSVLSDVAESYVALSDVSNLLGEEEQSWEYFQKALALYKTVFSATSPEPDIGASASLSSADWVEAQLARIVTELRSAEASYALAQQSESDMLRRGQSAELLARKLVEDGDDESLRAAKDAVESAKAAIYDAGLAVRKSAARLADAERELHQVEALLRAARRFGTFAEKAQADHAPRRQATDAYDGALKRLALSERMFAKGYISELQLQADRLHVEKAKQELARLEEEHDTQRQVVPPRLDKATALGKIYVVLGVDRRVVYVARALEFEEQTIVLSTLTGQTAVIPRADAASIHVFDQSSPQALDVVVLKDGTVHVGELLDTNDEGVTRLKTSQVRFGRTARGIRFDEETLTIPNSSIRHVIYHSRLPAANGRDEDQRQQEVPRSAAASETAGVILTDDAPQLARYGAYQVTPGDPPLYVIQTRDENIHLARSVDLGEGIIRTLDGKSERLAGGEIMSIRLFDQPAAEAVDVVVLKNGEVHVGEIVDANLRQIILGSMRVRFGQHVGGRRGNGQAFEREEIEQVIDNGQKFKGSLELPTDAQTPE